MVPFLENFAVEAAYHFIHGAQTGYSLLFNYFMCILPFSTETVQVANKINIKSREGASITVGQLPAL